MQVTKTGYTDLLNYKIVVEAGKTTKVDVQITKLPSALRVVDGTGKDINVLDFGGEASVITRSFSIFNNSPESLYWIITNNCEWITALSNTTGTLPAGKQTPINLTIDRAKLSGGDNTYILNITSDNGSKELIITAIGSELPTLNTTAVTDITTTTATFNGTILYAGSPSYTERGFVYSTSSMPTIETTIKIVTASITSNTAYSALATGLTLGETYYVRAYAKNSRGIAYSSNEMSFTATYALPSVGTQAVTNVTATTATFNGSIITVGDPAYTERGFVYAQVRNPTIEDDTKKTVTGTDTGAFYINVTGLTTGTTYYVRAYAINSKGTVYGSEISFIPATPQYIILQVAGLMVQKTDLGSFTWSTAMSSCNNSILSGYTDWRLPTKDELAILYNERNTIGGFATTLVYYSYYWSSTEDSSYPDYYAWYQSFSTGKQDYGNKSGNYYCRCVRTLP